MIWRYEDIENDWEKYYMAYVREFQEDEFPWEKGFRYKNDFLVEFQ